MEMKDLISSLDYNPTVNEMINEDIECKISILNGFLEIAIQQKDLSQCSEELEVDINKIANDNFNELLLK